MIRPLPPAKPAPPAPTVVHAAETARAIVAAVVAAVVVAIGAGLVPVGRLLGVRVAFTFAAYVFVFFRLLGDGHRAAASTGAVGEPDVFSELLDRLHETP